MQNTCNQKDLLLNCFGNSAHEVVQLCDVNTVYSLKLRFLLISFYVYVGGREEETLPSHFREADGNTL